MTTGVFHNAKFGFPNSQFDYQRFIADNNIAARISSGEIDEVWLWTGNTDASQTYESTMAGPGAYWCNSPPVPNVPSTRDFVIMGWNFERGVAEALHSFGHRSESIMDHSYGNQSPDLDNNWDRFTYQDRYGSGLGGIGNIHFPVNGLSDYDYDNRSFVLSTADEWASYPNLTGTPRLVNSDEWSPTHVDPQLDYMNWWYSHLPHFAGKGPDGFLDNWWRYITDPDQFKAGSSGNLDGSFAVAQARVTSPSDGSVAGGKVTLTAGAFGDGALGDVDFFVDGTYVGTDTLAPYSVVWDASAAAPGAHQVVAHVRELQHQAEFLSDPITVTIQGQNAAPVLAPIADRSIDEGRPLSFTVAATGADRPANRLIFALIAGAPPGAAIDPATGIFSWVGGDGPATWNVVVAVTDDGSPVLGDRVTFTIHVLDVAPWTAAIRN